MALCGLVGKGVMLTVTVVNRTCLGTYNGSQSYYTDTEIDNAGRSWTWITYVPPDPFTPSN